MFCTSLRKLSFSRRKKRTACNVVIIYHIYMYIEALIYKNLNETKENSWKGHQNLHHVIPENKALELELPRERLLPKIIRTFLFSPQRIFSLGSFSLSLVLVI